MKNDVIYPALSRSTSNYCKSSDTEVPADLIPGQIKHQQNQCDQRSFLESFVENQPSYSECARFLKRPLSWAPWIRGLSDGGESSYLGRHNLEFLHEHIFFDQSKDQIGFGPEGLFVEDPASKGYRKSEDCVDGAEVRETLRALEYHKKYNFLSNNCQDFAATVKKALK